MPGVRKELRGGAGRIGGAIGYPSDRILEEVAYIAYHLHWPYAQLMTLDHLERRSWIEEVAKINQRINQAQLDAQE
ncbi:MAG TPA: DUF6760 family protein [Paraburkholderia sp.]|nr:DUF6760 family protein [Paraburkholderia sp.]